MRAEFRNFLQKFIGFIPPSMNRSFPQSLSKYKCLNSNFLQSLARHRIHCVKKHFYYLLRKQESGSFSGPLAIHFCEVSFNSSLIHHSGFLHQQTQQCLEPKGPAPGKDYWLQVSRAPTAAWAKPFCPSQGFLCSHCQKKHWWRCMLSLGPGRSMRAGINMYRMG